MTETKNSAWADVREWISSLRFGGYTLVLVGILVLGVITISPTLSTFLQQRREINDLRAQVAKTQEAVTKAQADRERWEDPAYVRAQARDRLFYVMPGESQLGVINDIMLPPEAEQKSTPELTQVDYRWSESLLSSVLIAGTAADPAASDPAASDPAGSDPAGSDPAESDSTETE